MTYLLDANILIARCFERHVHHLSAKAWTTANPSFAVCPISEGALARFIVRSGGSGPEAEQALAVLSGLEGYEFWPDDVSYRMLNLRNVHGHKQVTDAYLVALAAARGGRLATFDEALTAVHPATTLVPFVD